jgi:hypothetical protein
MAFESAASASSAIPAFARDWPQAEKVTNHNRLLVLAWLLGSVSIA